MSQPGTTEGALGEVTRRALAGALLIVVVGASGMTAARATALHSTCSFVAPPSAAPRGTSSNSAQTVIVTGANEAKAVGCVGGKVRSSYRMIGAEEITASDAQLWSLRGTPGVHVIPDVPVSVESATAVSSSPHTPSDVFLKETGASKLVNSGDSGQGVTVAVLDTGIDGNLPDFAGRLAGGVDLTGEGNAFRDDYGHGTFVAGLIAGNGASSGGAYQGEAPGAGLVSIKVAGPSGQTDLATVMSGVQWAIDNRQAYGIRVLNLSLGYQPPESTFQNPLDQEVEAAWVAGIAVIVSAGNAGPFNGTILSPADDPLAITVGSLDDMATASVNDDEMTDFSSVGPTAPDGWVKPDLVAPGRSIVSLADPGSTIYNQYPSARIGSANFVGSGTSFSAAITSGAAALVMEANPSITPNQLKARLLGTTNPGPIGNPFVDGHGALNALAALQSAPMAFNQSMSGLLSAQTGTLVSLSNNNPVDTWNPSLWSGVSWSGASWNGASWNGASWNGASWNGFTWNGTAWNGASWNGASWNGASWNGASWNGGVWNGSEWS